MSNTTLANAELICEGLIESAVDKKLTLINQPGHTWRSFCTEIVAADTGAAFCFSFWPVNANMPVCNLQNLNYEGFEYVCSIVITILLISKIEIIYVAELVNYD